MPELTAREEDYLETIYRISLKNGAARVSEVARARNVTVPTARTAVAKLIRHGLVAQEHYGRITLKQKGRSRAEEIYTVHRALLSFLTEVLLLDPEHAEAEACRMEHGLSRETLSRLVLFLETVERSGSAGTEFLSIFREALADEQPD
jgi:DtxR family Mn-dependent transcriptional regulator